MFVLDIVLHNKYYEIVIKSVQKKQFLLTTQATLKFKCLKNQEKIIDKL